MLKKSTLIIICLLFFSSQFSIKATAHNESSEPKTKNNIAVCRLIGGNERVLRTFRVTNNSAEINNSEEVLDVNISGDVSSSRGERSIFSSVEVGNVTGDSFRPNKLLKNNSTQANLIIEVNEGDQQIAIVALNRDENDNDLISPVKLKLTSIKKDIVNGTTEVIYPRTITLPLDSPNLVILKNIIVNGQDGELNIDDGTENGEAVLKCQFQGLPYEETTN